jgi:hypothetical protein
MASFVRWAIIMLTIIVTIQLLRSFFSYPWIDAVGAGIGCVLGIYLAEPLIRRLKPKA